MIKPQDQPVIFAVTVNWNRPNDTIQCVNSLIRQTDYHLEFIIVDNGSGDNSVERIREAFPEIQLLTSKTNLGFASGFNLGIKQALQLGAQYILIINNDTLAGPELVKALIESDREKIGALGPIIFYMSQPQKVWSMGSRISHLLLDTIDQHGRKLPLPQVPIERDFLSGCCLLLRRDVLNEIGLFDERFFLYYEDMDFSLRIRHKGYRLMIVPDAHLWHSVSISSKGSDSPNERYWMGRSSVLYFRKHIHGARWLVVLPWRIGSLVKTILHLLIQHNSISAKAYLQGILAGLHQPIRTEEK